MSTTTETITYTACGHTERTQITWYGNARQRDAKIAWTRDNLTCTDCAEAARIARGEASTMSGGPKQCAWAEDIRAAAAARWAELKHRASAQDIEHAERILAITDAKWWIDNRNDPFRAAAPADAVTTSTIRSTTWATATAPHKSIRIGRW